MAGRVNEIISEAKELNTKADRLSASVSLKSGQAPVQNPMQVNPPELPKVGDDNASVINLAVQNSQFQVSVTAQQMENSQLLYQKAHEDMQAIAEQLNKFTAEIKKLNEEEVDVSDVDFFSPIRMLIGVLGYILTVGSSSKHSCQDG